MFTGEPNLDGRENMATGEFFVKTAYGGDDGAGSFIRPVGVAIDNHADSMYISDETANTVSVIERSTGNITTLSMAEETETVSLNRPTHLFSSYVSSTLYISDTGNHRILQVSSGSGLMYPFAGNEQGSTANGVIVTNASIPSPSGLWGDVTDEFLFYSDEDSHRVRQIDLTTLTITDFAGQYG